VHSEIDRAHAALADEALDAKGPDVSADETILIHAKSILSPALVFVNPLPPFGTEAMLETMAFSTISRSAPAWLLVAILLALWASPDAQASDMKRVKMYIGGGLAFPMYGDMAQDLPDVAFGDQHSMGFVVEANFELAFCPFLTARLTGRFQTMMAKTLEGSVYDDSYSPVADYTYQFHGFETVQILLGGKLRFDLEKDLDDLLDIDDPDSLSDFVPYLCYSYGIAYMLGPMKMNVQGTWVDGNAHDGDQVYWKGSQVLFCFSAGFGVDINIDATIGAFVQLEYVQIAGPAVSLPMRTESSALGSFFISFGIFLPI
jgi:hypothetical protein